MSRVYPKRRRFGTLRALLLLAAIILLSALLHQFSRSNETLVAGQAPVHVTDGDSFMIGKRRLRLDGIDAPEYRQTCRDAGNRIWECGKAARASLEKLLLQPGLVCEAEAADRYGRALAKCRTAATPDIAAAQTGAGMAMSHEYYGIRDYGDEEDAARQAGSGIWAGIFQKPEEWRATNRLGAD